MTAWLAVAAVGLGSYAFRWAPLVLAGRRGGLPPGVERSLRHASLGAVVALAVGGLRAEELTGSAADGAATAAALVAAGTVVALRRPMVFVLGAGLAAHALVLAVS